MSRSAGSVFRSFSFFVRCRGDGDAAEGSGGMSDRTLTCRDCGQAFTFTAGEQAFYAERGFSEPQRCPSCRSARKAQRASQGYDSGYGGGMVAGRVLLRRIQRRRIVLRGRWRLLVRRWRVFIRWRWGLLQRTAPDVSGGLLGMWPGYRSPLRASLGQAGLLPGVLPVAADGGASAQLQLLGPKQSGEGWPPGHPFFNSLSKLPP